jgi:DUF4097 and DUF4098 domain-containing protein YvlB
MKIRIAYTFILYILVSLSPAFAQKDGEFSVPLSDPAKKGKLKVDVKYGSITVKGTGRKDILVRYSSEDDDDKNSESRGGLRKIGGGTMDLEVSEADNSVRIESNSWSKKTNLTVEVPSAFDLIVIGYNDSDLLVSNIQGEVELTSYNGEIEASDISGSVVATTYNGDIKVTFVKVTEATPMSYSTYNGDIDLSFPSTLKASLKMKTEQGEIFTDFDVNLVKSGPVQKKDSKSGTFKVVVDEWVKGDVNGGGPEFSMKNYNGDILIRKRQ